MVHGISIVMIAAGLGEVTDESTGALKLSEGHR